jgi:hypothetical protein
MAEESFFRYFADKNVPLVFVFTKYDKLVTTFFAESFQMTGCMTATAWTESEQKAQGYVANIREKLESTVGKGVTVQAVDDKSEATGSRYQGSSMLTYSTRADNERVNTLVKSTMNMIRPNLRGLLARAQAVSATLKREGMVPHLGVRFENWFPSDKIDRVSEPAPEKIQAYHT